LRIQQQSRRVEIGTIKSAERVKNREIKRTNFSSEMALANFGMPIISKRSVLVLFYILLVTDQSANQRIQMIPDGDEQVIDVNSTLTLTCISELDDHDKSYNISWMLPEYLDKFPKVLTIIISNYYLYNHLNGSFLIFKKSDAARRLQFTFGDNETHLITTMTLIETTIKDSGEFGCAGRVNVSQYVYVYS
jgi:hypothetical protein